MARNTYASVFRLYVQFVTLRMALSFNLDTKYAVIKQGPPGSFFGFAVAEHQVTDGGVVEQWILASAPVANTTLIPKSVESGTVFKCNARNSSKACDAEIAFDIRGSSSTENKNHQWFGVSLLSGGKDKFVAACAHRYLHYALSGQYDLLEGTCRSLKGKLKGTRGTRETYNPCRSLIPTNPSHENYGQCLTGIGLDTIEAESSEPFLMGAVGINNFEGRTFEVSQARGDATENTGTGKKLSYFGYSVANGKYLSQSRIDVAMGGPRSNSVGKVVILKRVSSPSKQLTALITLPNKDDKVELASGFGFAVCSYIADPKNPGYAYLIVGAPFHSVDVAESGQVYVYHRSSETTMKLISKLSVGVSRANFGSAIISPGDLNLDGYNDIVIGAPYENDFRGAVYVYMGSAKGLPTKYSQKILASVLDNNLRGFGRSLAGGMDLDANNYNDVVVGAYSSDRVALLRSRPVIKIIAEVTTLPATINPDNYKSSFDSFDLVVKYRYEERSKRLTQNIDADLVVTVDPGRSPRLKFQLDDKSTVKQSVRVRPRDGRQFFQTYLVRDKDGNFQSYPDVKVSLTFKLDLKDVASSVKDQVVSLDKRPILESTSQDVSTQVVHKFDKGFIHFKRDCDPCIPDLAVTSDKNLTIRLGKADVKLNTVIKNIGKNTAYQTSLLILLPKGISVSYIKLAKSANTKLCNEPVALPDGRTETKCKDLFVEIKSKKEEKMSVVLDTKQLDGDLDYKRLVLNVTSENIENGTYSNNIFDTYLEVVAVADLQLEGNAITRREFYGGSIVGESKIKKDTEAGHIIKHRYFVINNGPDPIPSAIITIDWPYQTISGKHLLYLMDVQSSGANCTFARGQVNELRLQSSLSSVINFNSTSIGSLTLNRQRRDVSKNTTTPVTSTPVVLTTTPPTTTKQSPDPQKGVQKEGRVLDCRKGTAMCTRFTCQVSKFKSRSGVQIVVIGRIWNSSLLMDYKSETLSVVSYAAVAVGLNASYISDPNLSNNKASIFTVLYSEVPKSVKERVAIWKIILAVLAGIILLALLVFGLYKLGFFKRTDRSRLRKNQRKQAANEDDELLDKKVPLDDQD